MSDLVTISDQKAKSLVRFNLIMGFFHLIQGVVMVLLSNKFVLPVMTNYLNYDASTRSALPQPEKLFDLRVGYAVASFLFMSALAHFYLVIRKKSYIEGINNHRNYTRWIEYAFSSSVMIVIIAMLCGIYDIGALLALFGLNALMNLFGLLMERTYGFTQKADWLSFAFGCIAGVIPWIVITVYFLGAAGNADGVIPTFVYAILGSLFLTFNIFAVNMFLQYKKVGKWKNYVYGEVTFIVLSLVAKSLLAWQVFSGTLR
jgi:Heliorhodopsin